MAHPYEEGMGMAGDFHLGLEMASQAASPFTKTAVTEKRPHLLIVDEDLQSDHGSHFRCKRAAV
jgi:hypothetical protein